MPPERGGKCGFMAEKTVVDARGEACPLPVVHAAKALAGMTGGVLEVLVDNEIAVQNLERMASGKGLKCTAARAEGGFAVEIEAASGAAQPEAAPACAPDKRGELVIAVDTDRMGRGDDKLGALLMKSFLFAVTQLPELPRKMIFYNGGAKLTTEGSESSAPPGSAVSSTSMTEAQERPAARAAARPAGPAPMTRTSVWAKRDA